MLKIYQILSDSLPLWAVIFTIYGGWKRLNKLDTRKEKKKYLLLSIGSLIIIVFVVSYLYDQYGERIRNPPPEKKNTEIIDIRGSYTGFFTDELGTQIPTYLKIEYNNASDSIVLKFKNNFSVTLNAEYILDENLIIIESIGKGNVINENRTIIIESQENTDKKWEFTKEILGY